MPVNARARFVAIALLALVALSGCFPCDGVAVPFPDHPVIVGGSWSGVAASPDHPDIALLLELEVAYEDRQRYAVSGTLDLDGDILTVDGSGYGVCEQRFVLDATAFRATPAPEAPRFEANLRDTAGALVGSLLVYRLLESDGDTMRGELRLQNGASERSYALVAERR
jgi:hypothetical protein